MEDSKFVVLDADLNDLEPGCYRADGEVTIPSVSDTFPRVVMTLEHFLLNCTVPNTLCRIWKRADSHRKECITDGDNDVFMNWEVSDPRYFWIQKYKHCLVEGVTSILCSTDADAVNIVIKV